MGVAALMGGVGGKGGGGMGAGGWACPVVPPTPIPALAPGKRNSLNGASIQEGLVHPAVRRAPPPPPRKKFQCTIEGAGYLS